MAYLVSVVGLRRSHEEGTVENAPDSGLTCTSCGQSSVIEIAMTLPDDTEVVFCSCHVCEARWWDKGGEQIDVDRIIDIVSD
ncbi:MAG: hypothetical protein KDB69_00595 [Acidimicrobiia bacterium]|nr:hypothetical protein [Acidimicrobiia bacterium]